MATLVKNNADPNGRDYGAGPHYYLHQCILGGGSGNSLTVAAVNDANNPPCAAEILTANITRSGTGVFVVTLLDAYYAVAYAGADTDDSVGDGAYCNIGNWTNLQTSTAAQFTLRFYSATGVAADPASGRRIYVYVCFKKDPTGAVA